MTRILLLASVLSLTLGCPSSGDDDDTTAAADDDDDSAPVDPCGAVYEPQSPLSGDTPVAAAYTDQGIGASAQPLRVRTGVYGDPTTSLAVLWETDVDTTASVVEWGAGDAGENRKPGYSFLLGPEGGDQVRVHEARICDLEPGSTIQYRVGADGAMSDGYTYSTFDPAADSLSFMVLGDTRGGHDTHDQLTDDAMTRDPRFMLHTGDYLFLANSLDEWAEFFGAATPELASMPLLPVHGNHELFLTEYFGMVAAPGNEEWYSLDLGPLHLAVINDSRDDDSIDEQAQWLDQDLAKSTAAFDVVVSHRAFYSSGNHGSTETLQERIGPILDAHAVPLVFSGHDHGYERTWPLVGGEVALAGGTTYIVTAGGGADLYGFDGDWFTAYTESAYHYIHVAIAGDQLTMQAIRLDGTVMDELVIGASRGAVSRPR
jgi:acid phosphatase type 7